MSPTKPTSVDEYIAVAAPAARAHLVEIRAILRDAAPAAEESLKWNQPALSLNRVLYQFAAHKSFLSFYPTPAAITAFEADLGGYSHTGATIRFPYDSPLPTDLIRRIADYRVRDVIENDARWM